MSCFFPVPEYSKVTKLLENAARQTLVVNLFGGPCVGKTTTASYLCGMCKEHGIKTVYVPEFAADLSLEENWLSLNYQPLITSTQAWKIIRCLGKTEVVITDGPPLLGVCYNAFGSSELFNQHLVDSHKTLFWNLDILLQRNPNSPYNMHGRRQTEIEAKQVDSDVKSMLDRYKIDYMTFPMEYGNHSCYSAAQDIMIEIYNRLDQKKEQSNG